MPFLSVIDKDKGFQRELRRHRNADGIRVLVGFHGDEPPYPDGTSIAEVAAFNEFGTSRIPARPFMRNAVDKYQDSWFEQIRKDRQRGLDEHAIAQRLGLRMVGDIRQEITDLDTPPNAPSTIARKGSSNPLIDTGRMRQSVKHKVVK